MLPTNKKNGENPRVLDDVEATKTIPTLLPHFRSGTQHHGCRRRGVFYVAGGRHRFCNKAQLCLEPSVLERLALPRGAGRRRRRNRETTGDWKSKPPSNAFLDLPILGDNPRTAVPAACVRRNKNNNNEIELSRRRRTILTCIGD